MIRLALKIIWQRIKRLTGKVGEACEIVPIEKELAAGAHSASAALADCGRNGHAFARPPFSQTFNQCNGLAASRDHLRTELKRRLARGVAGRRGSWRRQWPIGSRQPDRKRAGEYPGFSVRSQGCPCQGAEEADKSSAQAGVPANGSDVSQERRAPCREDREDAGIGQPDAETGVIFPAQPLPCSMELGAWRKAYWQPRRTQVAKFWDKLPERIQARVMHMFPKELRRQAFIDIVMASPWAAMNLRCLAWVEPLFAGSPTVALHLACNASRLDILASAQVFLPEALARYPNLIAGIPRPFRDMRVLAETLGFRHMARIPGASKIGRGNQFKFYDAELYLYG